MMQVRDTIIKVLLVDDQEIVRNSVRLQLCSVSDIEVAGEAKTAKEARHVVLSQDFDVVLLDINLPDESGLFLIKRLRESRPGLAILVHSLHTEECYARYALKEGATGYLTKGCPVTSLIAAIRAAAAGNSSASQVTSEKSVSMAKKPTKEGVRQWLKHCYLPALC
jgi:DNA-binding NarL/FixJ family response regulator